MPDRLESYKVICRGGLNSNENSLDLAENAPGSATRLVNYEPSLFGGYRRVEGFEAFDTDYPEVDDGSGSAEGKVLCIAMFRNEEQGNAYAIAARKDVGADTYSFYKHVPLVGWQKMNTGLSQATTDGVRTVNKIRHVQFDFGDGGQIAFADGVNPAKVFDGVNWYEVTSSGDGTTNNPGGPQVVDAPALVDAFENHLFLGGDRTAPSVVCHSAPNNPLNFNSGAGAGQIPVGFNIVQFKPFRDNLFIFGPNAIKRIKPDVQAGFVIEQVTANVGCIARDSVQEIGGDLIFLAPDGFRPVAGTSRIGDVELETISKPIQGRLLQIISDNDLDTLNGVVVRSKSQVRYFVGDDTVDRVNSIGVLGGLTDRGGQIGWEYADLLGFRASCTSSEYVGREEFVLHGDYDGRVYRQEVGNSFDGEDIVSVYSTPYLDFGDTEIRKVLHKINTFIRAEGPFTLNVTLDYDWGDIEVAKPSAYSQSSTGTPTVYDGRSISYGGDNVQYGGSSKPVMLSDIQGSGYSARATFVAFGQSAPHSIQGMVFEFALAGRR
jgi:hypothetical protein